jgi:hypothetical protein
MADKNTSGEFASRDDLFVAKLMRMQERAVENRSDEHPLRQPGDPSVAEFTEAVSRGLTDEERRRWGDSPYCARLLRLHWRSEHPSVETLLGSLSGELTGFEASALNAHLEEPEGVPTKLLLRSEGLRAAPEELVCNHARISERFQQRAGEAATLLVILRQTLAGSVELSVQTRDTGRAGRAYRVEVIGDKGALSSLVLTLKADPPRQAAAAVHVYPETVADLAARLGEECCVVVTSVD